VSPRRQPQPIPIKGVGLKLRSSGGTRTPRMRSRRTIHGRLPVGTALRNRGWELKQRLAGCQLVVDVFFIIVEGMFVSRTKNAHAHGRADAALLVSGGGTWQVRRQARKRLRTRGWPQVGWLDRRKVECNKRAVGVFACKLTRDALTSPGRHPARRGASSAVRAMTGWPGPAGPSDTTAWGAPTAPADGASAGALGPQADGHCCHRHCVASAATATVAPGAAAAAGVRTQGWRFPTATRAAAVCRAGAEEARWPRPATGC
jgi:hypothetical protein